MKRKILVITAGLMIFLSGIAFSESMNGSFEGNPIVKIYSNGKELVATDVPSIIYHNRTMVPLSLLKQAGFDVTWNQNDYSVELNEHKRVVSYEDIQRMANCVKRIDVYDDKGINVHSATGFLISLDGIMITASHVKDNYPKFIFNYGSGYTFSNMDFNNTVKDVTGITLGKLPGHESDVFPYLKISTRIPKVGEPVYVIGYPNGKFSLTQGFVKSIIDIGAVNGDHTIGIESTAATAPGSSGGPMLDQYGEVIGSIDSGGGTGENAISIATSAIYIQQELDKLPMGR